MMRPQFPIHDRSRRENVPAGLIERLPSFLIVGTGKSGTTSLCDNLAQHPMLALSVQKEIHYFCAGRYNRGPEYYASWWPAAGPKQLRFEGTVLYMYLPCQDRIAALLPDVKAIMLLRDPVKRAWSQFWLHDSRKGQPLPPASSLMNAEHELVRRGIYLPQIQRWHSYFPERNLLILKSEDYFGNEQPTLDTVCDFLGVKRFMPDTILKTDPWAERKKQYGYPPIPDNVREWLASFYEPHNCLLSEYLGRDFTWKGIA